MARAARTHYERLGVAPHATHEEIQRAYRRLARLHHPDANPAGNRSGAARASMIEINAAWEVLGDPEKRQAYDYAIGTTPRPRFSAGPFATDIEDDDVEEGDPLTHLRDGPETRGRPRPADLLVAIPVLLLLMAVAMFFFSAMSESTLLRTASLALVPVDVAAFVAAPLFMMLRARERDRSG
jgi:curved DNA-binding protein CbpA